MRRGLTRTPPQLPSAAWIFIDKPDGAIQLAQVFFPQKSLVAGMTQTAITRYRGQAIIIVQPVILDRRHPALALQWANTTGCAGATAQRFTHTALEGLVFQNVEPHPCPIEQLDDLLRVALATTDSPSI